MAVNFVTTPLDRHRWIQYPWRRGQGTQMARRGIALVWLLRSSGRRPYQGSDCDFVVHDNEDEDAQRSMLLGIAVAWTLSILRMCDTFLLDIAVYEPPSEFPQRPLAER